MDDDPQVQPQEAAAASPAPGKPVRKRPAKRAGAARPVAAPTTEEPASGEPPIAQQAIAAPRAKAPRTRAARSASPEAGEPVAPGRKRAASRRTAAPPETTGPDTAPTEAVIARPDLAEPDLAEPEGAGPEGAESSSPTTPVTRRPRRAPAAKRATSPLAAPAGGPEIPASGVTPGGLVLPGRPHLGVSERVPASAVRVPAAKIALSTASVYPESVASAFEIARRLGYDGIELLVFTDPVSQDPDAVRALSDYYGVPVLSVHSPCLLVTQRVWSSDPWEKLKRSQAAAEQFGASTVVVHPPFRWQRDYGRDFEIGLARMRDETDVIFAVENMYPWRARNREWAAYLPDWDPRNQDYPHITLDLSHTAVSGTPALAMAADFGDRLAHIHLADGTGLARDEHLIPGRGNQPCAELLEGLAVSGFAGTIVIEVSTRKAANRAEREADLAEALAFARLYLAAPLESTPS